MVAGTVTKRDINFTIAGFLIFSIGAGMGSYYGFGNNVNGNLSALQWGAVIGISVVAGFIGAALFGCISHKTTLIDDLVERCKTL